MTMYRAQVIDSQLLSLSTRRSVSGSIATFDTDKAERLVNLEVAITATGGGGTPDSPIAINGWSSATINSSSVNIWNEQWEVGSLSAGGAEISSTTQFRNVGFIKTTPSTTLYIKSPFTNGIQIYQFDSSKTYIRRDFIKDTTITLQATTAFIRFRTPDTSPVTYGNDISINYPSTDTSYHSFSGAVVDFGQTIYGGSLNVGSGVLTVTHGYVTLNSANRQGTMGTSYYAFDNVNGKPNDMVQTDYVSALCDKYICATSSSERSNGKFYLLSGTIIFVDDRFTDVATANSIMQSETPTVIYPLATPIEIQLDSKQIQAIIGTNNIYADTGDIIDLKFVLSVGKAIS